MFPSKQFISVVAFVAGVIACYQGALTQKLWLGPVVVGLIILYELSNQRDRIIPKIKLLLIIGLGSAVFESVLIIFSIYSVNEATRWFMPAPLIPMWIFSLWMNYAARIPTLIPALHGKHLLNFIMGMFFGTVIYLLADLRELVELNYGWISLLVIAMAWGFFISAIYQFAPRIYKPS